MKKYNTNKNNELNKLLMEKFNFGGKTLNEGKCAGNREEEEINEGMYEYCSSEAAAIDYLEALESGNEQLMQSIAQTCPGVEYAAAAISRRREKGLDDSDSVMEGEYNRDKKKDKKVEEGNTSFRREVRDLMEQILKLK